MSAFLAICVVCSVADWDFKKDMIVRISQMAARLSICKVCLGASWLLRIWNFLKCQLLCLLNHLFSCELTFEKFWWECLPLSNSAACCRNLSFSLAKFVGCTVLYACPCEGVCVWERETRREGGKKRERAITLQRRFEIGLVVWFDSIRFDSII